MAVVPACEEVLADDFKADNQAVVTSTVSQKVRVSLSQFSMLAGPKGHVSSNLFVYMDLPGLFLNNDNYRFEVGDTDIGGEGPSPRGLYAGDVGVDSVLLKVDFFGNLNYYIVVLPKVLPRLKTNFAAIKNLVCSTSASAELAEVTRASLLPHEVSRG